MDLFTVLIILHLAGTFMAVGGATMIELHLTRALKDGQITPDEGSMLGLDYSLVRFGFVISILSGFGFLILYKLNGQAFRLHDPILWAKLVLVLIVGINALLLQAHKINLYWGAAFSFVSWWGIALLGIFLTNGVKFDLFGAHTFISTFMSVILLYAVAIVAGAYLLHIIRQRIIGHS